ncbi:uncharacterized protein BP01DRAFT_162661 [Aspergillus saccharolyticus JOP 1030-1]|uniref:Uncharacterized protein n=1 Tax=Aspergillus saccharolyticus JOP 1030-1 TaxID=1450539 RepID=A0A318Z5N8_9EURO|nr:hypothetical protein BP01DRAFT_162661 [Aspergillus saccharolyticus JOP 1030-1]PYH41667.1 hypothetical protein BP01DRAFT_162661 [Aspergillus saccharolyticus JOP 1030-1]
MAVFVGRGSLLRPCLIIWIVLGTIINPGASQFCSFWSGSCVDALAQTAVSFQFPPLFTDNLNLYYGFDANSRGKGQQPMTKVSYWLSYGGKIDNSIIIGNHTTEVGLRVGNLTGTPSGSNNGCDGVWGPQCSTDLKALLTEALYGLTSSGQYYTYPLQTILSQMLINRPHLTSCFPQLFDVVAIPTIAFVQETGPDQTAKIQTAGSSNNPWRTWFIDNMTAHEQAAQVAVAIISRAPAYDGLLPQQSGDVQVELVCTQAPSSGGSSSSSEGS